MVKKTLEKKTEEQKVEETLATEESEAVITDEEIDAYMKQVQEEMEQKETESVKNATEQKAPKQKRERTKTIKEDEEIVKQGLIIIENAGEVRYNLKGFDKPYRTSNATKLRKDHKDFGITKVW